MLLKRSSSPSGGRLPKKQSKQLVHLSSASHPPGAALAAKNRKVFRTVPLFPSQSIHKPNRALQSQSRKGSTARSNSLKYCVCIHQGAPFTHGPPFPPVHARASALRKGRELHGGPGCRRLRDRHSQSGLTKSSMGAGTDGKRAGGCGGSGKCWACVDGGGGDHGRGGNCTVGQGAAAWDLQSRSREASRSVSGAALRPPPQASRSRPLLRASGAHQRRKMRHHRRWWPSRAGRRRCQHR